VTSLGEERELLAHEMYQRRPVIVSRNATARPENKSRVTFNRELRGLKAADIFLNRSAGDAQKIK